MTHRTRTLRARQRRLSAVVALAASFGLIAAGCGDDDDGLSVTATTDAGGAAATTAAPVATTAAPTETTAATSDTTTAPTTEAVTDTTAPSTTETTDGGGTVDTAAFCQQTLDTEQVATSGPDVDFETASEDEIQAAIELYAAELEPLLDALSENPPEEIADAVETIDTGLRSGIESGEDPFGQPGFVEADRAIDQWLADNCGFEMVTIRGVEYMFEDVPDTLEGGVVGFDFQNAGNEVHEMIVFRINDDSDATIEELLELPEEEAQEMATFVGAAFAAPGENDMSFIDLEPGRYGIVCFIPVGTVDMEMLEGEEAPEGPPHFTQGMHKEFEVT